LVTGSDLAAARGLEIGEKSADEIHREIDDSQTIGGLLLYQGGNVRACRLSRLRR
jgi:hypothetical protein